MIAIVDYGAGNIRSVVNVLKHFKADYILTDNPSDLKKADGIILPGVGAFGAAMNALNSLKLTDALIDAATSGKNLLGICLGLQMLFDSSEESAGVKGLGLIEGEVTRLKADNRKMPHIGWTSLENTKGKLLEGIESGEFFYFVHSYGAHAVSRDVATAAAAYGETFDACIEKDNIFGCQFHPEKSGTAGLKIINNFLNLCEKAGNK